MEKKQLFTRRPLVMLSESYRFSFIVLSGAIARRPASWQETGASPPPLCLLQNLHLGFKTGAPDQPPEGLKKEEMGFVSALQNSVGVLALSYVVN